MADSRDDDRAELIALIPYKDERLRPKRTYVEDLGYYSKSVRSLLKIFRSTTPESTKSECTRLLADLESVIERAFVENAHDVFAPIQINWGSEITDSRWYQDAMKSHE